MPAYAAIATDNGYVFIGDEPLVEVDTSQKAPSSEDFTPSFMSSKISALRDSLFSMKECLLRSPLSKYYSFSVNDCPRKIHAKNEKRRNRKHKQLFKEMAYGS